MTVAERAAEVLQRVAAAAARSGRDAHSVTVVAVTKGHPVSADHAAVAAGFTDLGENRVAALTDKAAVIDARWHMVGRLQTNKVRRLPDRLAVIHSVDRPSLIDALTKRYAGGGGPSLYVEVNVSGEPTKAGVSPDGLAPLLDHLAGTGLAVAGLMTVAPQSADSEAARPVFAALAELAARHHLDGLSMGMSDDFETAIEEGATVIRLGRAIFS